MATTTTPTRTDHGDPRFRVLGGEMEGWRLVGAWGLKMEAYFAWASRHWPDMPDTPDDMWLPRDNDPEIIGATASASQVPADYSDTSFFTEKALEYLHGVRHKPWFLHLGYYRPHPPFIAPEPWNSMYDPADSPEPIRAASVEEEAAQHPCWTTTCSRYRAIVSFATAKALAAKCRLKKSNKCAPPITA